MRGHFRAKTAIFVSLKSLKKKKKEKQYEHQSELNKDIFSEHKLKPTYIYLRLASCRGRQTHHPYDSALNALSLSF